LYPDLLATTRTSANEETQKKTITPQDVFAALTEIEFGEFIPRLERELAVYSEAVARKRRGKKEKKEELEAGKAGDAVAGEVNGGDGDAERGAKRLKRNDEREVAIGRPRPIPSSKTSETNTTQTELTEGILLPKSPRVQGHSGQDRGNEDEGEGEEDDTDEQEETDDDNIDDNDDNDGNDEDENDDDDEDDDNEAQPDDEDSDIYRRTHPDLDSDLESDSDAP
jgi:hypothetical protein